MSERPVIYCHLKRESPDPRRSNALSPTLCGREDSGQYYYQTLEPGEQAWDAGSYPICPDCAAEHEAGRGTVAV